MQRRFVSIWFRYLATDWFTLRQLAQSKNTTGITIPLNKLPFVLRTASRGRMMVTALNRIAEHKGIHTGMVLADARAIIPDLQVMDDKPELMDKVLHRLAEWCIRFTPLVAIDPPDGLLLDATGCTHLWGNEAEYLEEIAKRLNTRGYDVRTAMADTIGVAWGVARFGKESRTTSQIVIPSGSTIDTLMGLPLEALRLELNTVTRLHQLGLHQAGQLMKMPRSSLRRRFGSHLLSQLDKALGQQMEMMEPVVPLEPYQERLPCLEPITTASGIEIALRELLKRLCLRLQQEQKGMRSAVFKGYRVDGKVETISIGTHRPTHHVNHLFKLFEFKLPTIEPALGIELFILEAPKVEDHYAEQEKMWQESTGLDDPRLAELIDRLAGKIGAQRIHRYLPDEHYWPERSFKTAASLQDEINTAWREDKRRPLQLLPTPQRIEVTAPIPDYPPMLFRYQGKLHPIVKADGPERIEQEWWLQQGQHRDYYSVEDEEGHRYWIFRLGHYDDKTFQWFIHGIFA